ncbi:uncharacterized protein EI97DRAFT_371101 [Westerdykella ornata]|uniref:Signal recognition particle subunit SRP68 n=1 Tax=Westerdykella ornata TaxID=318751 RepID=A0A6A6JRZ5_WESOR|nr:uncharacterized protein EI97DRAFT_371101 [Westerdykella ornata]KAF2279167.1 hypothetical protein EI97DRAFT_371101 [Westerdykella ornata]
MDITKFIVEHRDAAFLVGGHDTYRAQLSRRLRTVRKKLGRATPKNAKFDKKVPVTAEDIASNIEFLHLLLLTSERAWAHAMDMKAAHSKDNADKNITGSTRRHIISRLHKAAQLAKGIVEILSDQTTSRATDMDLLEAQAYAYSLAGAGAFEKEAEGIREGKSSDRWRACLTEYSAARVIYNALFKSTKKELFKEFLVSSIDPSIRYAAYQHRIPRTVGVPAVSQKFFPKDDEGLVQAVEKLDAGAFREDEPSASGTTISWRGRTANIVDAAVGQALVSVETESTQLAAALASLSSVKERAAAYDNVLLASQDAADATRQAIEELEKEGVNEGDARMQDLRVTSLAVNYDLISWRVGRNRVLIGSDDGLTLAPSSTQKPRRPRGDGKEWAEREEPTGRKLARVRERVALYDAILQSIDSIKELRGAVRDGGFMAELDGQRAYFQALKCLNLSRSHAFLSSPREALALAHRAFSLSSQALSAPKSAPSSTGSVRRLSVSEEQAQRLNKTLEGLTTHYRGLVALSQLSGGSEVREKEHKADAVPVVERVNDYPASGTVDLNNLVTWPPRLKPVPVKPLFFDVAFNYIEYPGRAASAVEPEEEKGEEEPERVVEQKPAKKGWFGFGR